ncbi:MAG: hypothetical protein PVF27_06215 [Gemmatimonadales bacterium]|jgi:hypothetical protein
MERRRTAGQSMQRARGVRSGARSGAVCAVLEAALLACGGTGDASLRHAYDTPEALASAVLHAIALADRDSLAALMVTREEHREALWDQLPESDDLTFEFARDLNERNSRKGMSAIVSQFGGTRFELVSLDFDTTLAERYDDFTLHFVRRLVVRRARDGQVGTLPILDVVLERSGRWKLMNYDEL